MIEKYENKKIIESYKCIYTAEGFSLLKMPRLF